MVKHGHVFSIKHGHVFGILLSELPVLHSQDGITDVDGGFLLVSC